jgi:hypothetical protein
MDRYVPMELFAGLDLAVSAGGYNSFHELMYAGVPTVFLAQPKLADDQAARARRAAEAGAGRVVASLSDVGQWLENPGDPEAARRLVPENHARFAAARILSLMLPPEEVQAAIRAFPPSLLGVFAAHRIRSTEGLALLKAIHGDSRPAGLGVERVLQIAPDLPMEVRLPLVDGLRKRFPAATPSEFVEAVEALFGLWAPYADWMGALSLLRAVPVQRLYRISEFVRDLQTFLSGQEDLYEALRILAGREGGGRMTVAEALRLPGDGA